MLINNVIETQFKRIKLLDSDWSAFGSAVPNSLSIERAEKIYKYFLDLGIKAKRVDPSVEEGVCIAFSLGKCYADIECFNDGEILGIISNDEMQIFQIDMEDLNSAFVRIKQFLEYDANTSGSTNNDFDDLPKQECNTTDS